MTYKDGGEALGAARSVLENTKRYLLKLYIIDNASGDETPRLFDGLDGVKLIENPKNAGFGAAHNRALEEELGKYHFIINPDITIGSDVLSDMADFMEQNPGVSLCVPDILNADGSVQYLPERIPTFKRVFLGRFSKSVRDEYVMKNERGAAVREVDFCTGCFMCVRGETFRALGGFDTRYFMYMEDADLTLRAKKYGKTAALGDIFVTHLWRRESAKSLKYILIHTVSALRFLKRKGKLIRENTDNRL